ncbi:MAG: hypothetical protein ACHQNA_06500 [Acidimicrobiales bacterium]
MTKATVQQQVADHDRWQSVFADPEAVRRTLAPAGTRDRQSVRRADLAALAAAGVSYIMLVERIARLGPCPRCRPLLGRTVLIGDPLTTAALECGAGCLSFAPLYLE